MDVFSEPRKSSLAIRAVSRPTPGEMQVFRFAGKSVTSFFRVFSRCVFVFAGEKLRINCKIICCEIGENGRRNQSKKINKRPPEDNEGSTFLLFFGEGGAVGR